MTEPIQPPTAKKVSSSYTLHGVEIHDDYAWLKSREDDKPQDIIDHLEAENAYVEAKMEHTKALQEELYKDMLSRIKETDTSYPFKKDNYYYYQRTEEGKQYPISCRKKDSLDAPEEVILDVNKVAEGLDFCSIGASDVSPDHHILAYSVDESGDESHVLYFKDLRTGEMLPDQIENTEFSLEWANDNKTVFYTTMDDTNRPDTVWKHVIGTNPEDDVEVYHEEDQRFYVSVEKSLDDKFLFISPHSQITSEVWFISADEPDAEWKLFAPREQGVEYEVTSQNDDFLIVTNENAKNFKLMSVPIASHDAQRKDNWVEIIPHRDDVKLDDVDAFKNHLTIWERQGGTTTARVMNLKTREFHSLELPELVCVVDSATNAEFDSNILRFTYSSYTTPTTLFDYNMDTREKVFLKQQEVRGFDGQLYESKREYAVSHDGTKVPISIVYKKELLKKDGTNPLFLESYGAYGVPMDPAFDSKILSLLNRGFVYAAAHIRGGGDMGRLWYEDGKLLSKKNTFLDFIASAKHLAQEKYSSKERIAITGASAGGLLMGAVTTMAGLDICKAVVAEVPFVDCINTMLDPTLPLTVVEYEEWGNPQDKEFFEYMRSYSPYDTVTRKEYPAMLVTAGLNDPRVCYWEPVKLVAKIRSLKTDSNVLLLKTEMEEGHGGASGRYDFLKEIAFNFAFVIDQVGSA